MSKELKFASTKQAFQHLADITGKRIKIANEIDMEDIKNIKDRLQSQASQTSKEIWVLRENYIEYTEAIEELKKTDPKMAEKLTQSLKNNKQIKDMMKFFGENI